MKTESLKTKPAKAASPVAETVFDAPKLEVPRLDVPTMVVPAAFRELAEKGVSRAKDTYERMKSSAEETTEILEDTFAAATKGTTDYGLKVLDVARTNTNAAFDFARDLMAVRSLSEVIELSTAHARKQFEAFSTQSRELASLAQKVTQESAEPLKSGMTKAFNKVA